ncbi:MAG: HDOD domain-containing protein [bacterium]|nr:HDOD domain-containing protein [bacterium]
MISDTTDSGENAGGPRKRIGELLLEAGLITKDALEDGLAAQKKNGGKIVENLIALGHMEARTFVQFLARQPGIPSITLTNYQISPDLVGLIPGELAREHQLFPIDKMGKLLTVAMACPLDAETIQELETITGLRVKPILCPVNDIEAAIAKYYHVEGEPEPEGNFDHLGVSLKLESIATTVRKFESLPGLPETVERVREAMLDPEIPITDVARAISTDPPISAQLLTVANSAAYGFQSRVLSVEAAASLLGLKETYSIALSSAVIDLFSKSDTFDYQGFWNRSFVCGAAAKAIAEERGESRPSGVFSAGLLYDLGQLALTEVAGDRYAEIESGLDGIELVQQEEESLGLSHTEAGYELARAWGFPPELAEPIRFHHAPESAKEVPINVATVAIAAVMARAYQDETSDNPNLFEPCRASLEQLNLTQAAAAKVLHHLVETLEVPPKP